MTPAQAADAIAEHLAKAGRPPRDVGNVEVEVAAKNSKCYYVIADTDDGEQVYRFPYTGNETVTDALTRTGLPKLPSNPTISLLRGGQELRVDWPAISGRGMTYTNYQIMPGDRVRIAKRPVAFDYAAPAAPKPSAEPDNTHYINIRELAIPFDVNPARIKSIDALTVRVSRDRGRTWERLPSPKPEDKRFTFSAPDDGEYWFGVSVPG